MRLRLFELVFPHHSNVGLSEQVLPHHCNEPVYGVRERFLHRAGNIDGGIRRGEQELGRPCGAYGAYRHAGHFAQHRIGHENPDTADDDVGGYSIDSYRIFTGGAFVCAGLQHCARCYRVGAETHDLYALAEGGAQTANELCADSPALAVDYKN